jgi:hypothetical protein
MSSPSRFRTWRHALMAGLAAAGAAALLAACGGGTSQYDPFSPQRLFSVGDEASALADGSGAAPRGASWSVNGLSDTNQFNCALRPIWTQQLASLYGFVFAECPGTATEFRARTFAAAGAKVRDLDAQIDAARTAAGGFNDKDLVTYFAGTNDIIELYEQFPARSERDLLADARARGTAAALQVNRLISLGAKVIVSNLPDLTYSPYAQAQNTSTGDSGRAALIGRLAAEFNLALGVSILIDGRFVGLAQIDQRTQLYGRSPSAFGYTNFTSPVCATAPPLCTTGTLVTDGNADTWFWAGDRWFSPAGHSQLASLAITRAQRNPF